MSQDTQQQETITKSQIEAAIQAVIARGWDVNPYTVAEEARISPAEISRNAHFMQLIVHARGGEVTFAVKSSPPEELKRIADLERENADLRARLDAPEAKIIPDDDILNEQVKALLSSESDEQVKQLERELEQAYEQVVSLEEEKTDLTRSVAGLERVNDALNARMRQLEDEAVVLKKQAQSAVAMPQPQGVPAINPQILQDMEGLKTQNAAMDEQIQQFIAISREKSEYIGHLESANYQHESLILELEAKLAELQQEADMLALQLQNAFHVGYQKGLSDGKTDDEEKSEDTGSEEVQSELDDAILFPGDNPAHVATGEQPVMTPGQYYELHQQMPNVEIKTQPESDATKEAAAVPPTPTAPAPGSWDSDRVLNFARTGPYVASTFNPLQSLSWRDLETVYSMGVLSIKDFSRNLNEYRPTDVGPTIAETPQRPLDTNESYSQVQESVEVLGQAIDDSSEQSGLIADLLGEAPNPEPGLDFIDELIDIDKLDIFESLEELEELGTIDVLNDPINLPDFENADGAEEVQPASDDQLRDLIKARINQAQEQKVDQDVRTPPAPEGAEDDPTKSSKPFPGLKKFVGQKGQDAPPPPVTASSTTPPSVAAAAAKHTPPEIRKACMILGIRPEDLTKESVNREWKKQITSVHPDLGGDTDSAVFLNTAKDTLLRWLDQNTPKLGEKFGTGQGGSTRFTGKNKPNDKS